MKSVYLSENPPSGGSKEPSLDCAEGNIKFDLQAEQLYMMDEKRDKIKMKCVDLVALTNS